MPSHSERVRKNYWNEPAPVRRVHQGPTAVVLSREVAIALQTFLDHQYTDPVTRMAVSMLKEAIDESNP